MIKYLTSLKNQYIKDLLSLKNSSEKKKLNRFLVEGEDLVTLAYENNQLDLVISLEEQEKYSSIDQYVVNQAILEKLSNNKSASKIIGVAHFEKKEITGNSLVYLDHVQDPGNVGTIIRTALSFSYSGVLLSPGCASIYNEKVIQSSKGAIFKIPVLEECQIDDLKEKNYQIVSTCLKDAVDYFKVELNDCFVLVFGNEGQGICKDILKKSDLLIKIPMGNIDSLNVAVAAGILMNHYRS